MTELQKAVLRRIGLGFILGVMAGQFIHLHW